MGIMRRPLIISILAASLVLLSQFLTVRYNYDGNWTGLYHTGATFKLPPELANDNVYRVRASHAYDGQFYHLIGHDPLLKRGFANFADNARLRWRRILLPGLSFVLALGQDSRVHTSYVAVNLFFVFLGSYWLSRYCAENRWHPAWGVSFLLVPAVAVSSDRLTIDTALSALSVGSVLYATARRSWKEYAVLVFSPLARETGLCLVSGRFLEKARAQQWAAAFGSLVAALPYAGWVWFVHRNTFLDATPWLSYPFAGILNRTLHPFQYELKGPWIAMAAVLDYLALLGLWAALVLAARLITKEPWGMMEASIITFAFTSLWLAKPDIWFGAYEFGRTLSPLLLLLALRGLSTKEYWSLLPMALVIPRIALQLQPQSLGILRGLFSIR